MTKTVIMTTLQCSGYSGSELHILSLAKEFIKRDYKVTVVVLRKAYPLFGEYEKAGIKVFELGENFLLEKHYDIFFAQHYVVANALIDNYKFSFDRMIVSILSSYLDLEELPRFAVHADKIVFVSHEALSVHRNKTGNEFLKDNDNSSVFVNYAEEQFFLRYSTQREKLLKKVAVVSNHICEECLDFKKKAEETGLTVDLIGIQYKIALVDSAFLEQYDLIVTIGKTTQACFAQGLPVYVYDFFGGSGYITKENFQKNMNFNFSGRGFERKITGIEMFDDIVNNYSSALTELDWLHQIAVEKFNLSSNFEQLMQEVLLQSPQKRCLNDFYSEVEKQEHHVALESLKGVITVENAQVFFDSGNGYFADCVKNFPFKMNVPVKIIIPIEENLVCLRFDPLSRSCRVKNFKAVYEDGTLCKTEIRKNFWTENGEICFVDNDPNIFIVIDNKDARWVEIQFTVSSIEDVFLMKLLNDLKKNNDTLKSKNDCFMQCNAVLEESKTSLELEKASLEQQLVYLNKLKRSFLWKLTKPIRFFIHLIIRK